MSVIAEIAKTLGMSVDDLNFLLEIGKNDQSVRNCVLSLKLKYSEQLGKFQYDRNFEKKRLEIESQRQADLLKSPWFSPLEKRRALISEFHQLRDYITKHRVCSKLDLPVSLNGDLFDQAILEKIFVKRKIWRSYSVATNKLPSALTVSYEMSQHLKKRLRKIRL